MQTIIFEEEPTGLSKTLFLGLTRHPLLNGVCLWFIADRTEISLRLTEPNVGAVVIFEYEPICAESVRVCAGDAHLLVVSSNPVLLPPSDRLLIIPPSHLEDCIQMAAEFLRVAVMVASQESAESPPA